MSEGYESRWFQFSLRTLLSATTFVGVTAALVRMGYPELGLFGALPFAVGLMWGDMLPRGENREQLIWTSPLVACLLVGGMLFAWELFLSGDILKAFARTVMIAIGAFLFGAIPAIAGSLVAQSLK